VERTLWEAILPKECLGLPAELEGVHRERLAGRRGLLLPNGAIDRLQHRTEKTTVKALVSAESV
jgi:hypothetical protein